MLPNKQRMVRNFGSIQIPHQLIRRTLSTHQFPLSGHKCLLHKVIQMPGSVGNCVGHASSKHLLSTQVWGAQGNQGRGRGLNKSILDKPIAWDELSPDDQWLAENYDITKLTGDLDDLMFQMTHVYRGVSTSVGVP